MQGELFSPSDVEQIIQFMERAQEAAMAAKNQKEVRNHFMFAPRVVTYVIGVSQENSQLLEK